MLRAAGAKSDRPGTIRAPRRSESHVQASPANIESKSFQEEEIMAVVSVRGAPDSTPYDVEYNMSLSILIGSGNSIILHVRMYMF